MASATFRSEGHRVRYKGLQKEAYGPVVLLNQLVSGDLDCAKELAKMNRGELAESSELLVWLENGNNLENAKGYKYWLRDRPPLTISGLCKIDYHGCYPLFEADIEMVDSTEWLALPRRQRALAYPGKGPMWVDVHKSGDCMLSIFGTRMEGTDSNNVAIVKVPQIVRLRKNDELEVTLRSGKKEIIRGVSQIEVLEKDKL